MEGLTLYNIRININTFAIIPVLNTSLEDALEEAKNIYLEEITNLVTEDVLEAVPVGSILEKD